MGPVEPCLPPTTQAFSADLGPTPTGAYRTRNAAPIGPTAECRIQYPTRRVRKTGLELYFLGGDLPDLAAGVTPHPPAPPSPAQIRRAAHSRPPCCGLPHPRPP